MKLAIWVTMYNEPYRQIVESLAGIYRNYYELVAQDSTYENRVTVVIVWDGYAPFNKIGIEDSSNYLASDRYKRAGIFDEEYTEKYFQKKK